MPMADDEKHKAKMARRKAVQDAEVAGKTIAEKGLLIVNTGPGKGKSTAAFGLILRALGHGWKVGVVQFIKGAWSTGERKALERFPDLVSWHTMGEGFTWETQDRARDIAACRRAWAARTVPAWRAWQRRGPPAAAGGKDHESRLRGSIHEQLQQRRGPPAAAAVCATGGLGTVEGD